MTETQTSSDWRPTGVEHRPMGWWGMLLTVMVLATLYAAMYFTVIYLRVSVDLWPPEGISPPGLGIAVLAGGALLAAAAAARAALHLPVPGLLVLLATGGAHVWLVVADWDQPGFDATAHAYGSVSVVLPAVHLCFVLIGLIMGAVLLALSMTGRGPQHHVGMRSLALWWYAIAAGGVVLLALVYGLPHVWSAPWPVT